MFSQPKAQKHINEQLIAQWQELRNGRLFPREEEFSAGDDLWGSCFIVRVTSGKEPQFEYSFVGESLVKLYGEDPTGENIRAKNPHLADHLREVTLGHHPVIADDEFTTKKGEEVAYRSCLLPLGKTPPVVEYIVGGMRWKAS